MAYRVGTANLFDLLDGDEDNDPETTVQQAGVAAAEAAKKAAAEARAAAAREKAGIAKAPEQAKPQQQQQQRGDRKQGQRGDARGPRGEGQRAPRQQRSGPPVVDPDQVAPRPKERPPRRDRRDIREGAGRRPPKREFDRHPGTGIREREKRDGAGKANWGTTVDEAAIVDATTPEVEPKEEAVATEGAADVAAAEEETKQISLNDYYKQLAAEAPAIERPQERLANDGKAVEGFVLKSSKFEEKQEEGRPAKQGGKAKQAAAQLPIQIRFTDEAPQREARGRGRGDRPPREHQPREAREPREPREGADSGRGQRPRGPPRDQARGPRASQQQPQGRGGLDLKNESSFPSLKA